MHAGGTEGTFEYAIKGVYENLRNCKLLDIGIALSNAKNIGNQENVIKFFKRVESYIIFTHEQFMKEKNIYGII